MARAAYGHWPATQAVLLMVTRVPRVVYGGVPPSLLPGSVFPSFLPGSVFPGFFTYGLWVWAMGYGLWAMGYGHRVRTRTKNELGLEQE